MKTINVSKNEVINERTERSLKINMLKIKNIIKLHIIVIIR